MTEQREQLYFNLIDELLKCPNGQEPEVLESHSELIDSGLVGTMLQVATMFAHQGNQDGAQFLFYVGRELAKELGLYPEVANTEVPNTEVANPEAANKE
ncbi:MAG: hypothetical protein V7K21_28035 [Nostoc sp.]|uniref:hypothetical protein n=1 Tax=Nostoc sp. TaxID=1180 RepID=UPI002FF9457A